jgi:hypothetical protein
VYPKSIILFKGEYPDSFPWQHVPPEIQQALTDNWWATMWASLMDPTGQVDGDQKIGGWGPLFNVVCVPALIVAILMLGKRRAWTLLALLSVIILPWVCFPTVGQTWSRFVMPVTLAGYVGLGVILKEMEPKPWWVLDKPTGFEGLPPECFSAGSSDKEWGWNKEEMQAAWDGKLKEYRKSIKEME